MLGPRLKWGQHTGVSSPALEGQGKWTRATRAQSMTTLASGGYYPFERQQNKTSGLNNLLIVNHEVDSCSQHRALLQKQFSMASQAWFFLNICWIPRQGEPRMCVLTTHSNPTNHRKWMGNATWESKWLLHCRVYGFGSWLKSLKPVPPTTPGEVQEETRTVSSRFGHSFRLWKSYLMLYMCPNCHNEAHHSA